MPAENEPRPAQPSIREQAERIAAESPEGLAAGVVIEDGKAGAEASFKLDVGEPGGWSLAATGRWVKNAGRRLAAFVTWKPK